MSKENLFYPNSVLAVSDSKPDSKFLIDQYNKFKKHRIGGG